MSKPSSMERLLITGSAGLIGTALRGTLSRLGLGGRGVDIGLPARHSDHGDVRDLARLGAAARDCDGIVHLAAVSRVVWAERDPDLCWQTNVGGTRNVIEAALESPRRPWLIFASSREVYGQPEELPANEETPLRPLNIYGRAKVEGERLTLEAREAGLRTAIVRFSNVYGTTDDHDDRVIPAFSRAAATGQTLRVDGSEHSFDFVHIDDAVAGLLRMMEVVHAGERSLPPIHLVRGTPTTLGELAELACAAGLGRSRVIEAPPRSYDVARFWGDPSRAFELLGWRAEISVPEGVRRLVERFAAELSSAA